MKKRVKLLTTIASLCLAVALMAFGVYAAQTASLDVTSSVAFTTTNVDVTYTVSVEYTTAGVNRTAPETKATEEGEPVVDAEKGTTTITWTYTQGLQDDADASLVWDLGSYAFDENNVKNGHIVKYTVSITNNGSVAYDIVKGGTIPTNSEEGSAVTVEVNDAISTSIDGKATQTLVVTYTMADYTKDFATSTFAPTFEIDKP